MGWLHAPSDGLLVIATVALKMETYYVCFLGIVRLAFLLQQ